MPPVSTDGAVAPSPEILCLMAASACIGCGFTSHAVHARNLGCNTAAGSECIVPSLSPAPPPPPPRRRTDMAHSNRLAWSQPQHTQTCMPTAYCRCMCNTAHPVLEYPPAVFIVRWGVFCNARSTRCVSPSQIRETLNESCHKRQGINCQFTVAPRCRT